MKKIDELPGELEVPRGHDPTDSATCDDADHLQFVETNGVYEHGETVVTHYDFNLAFTSSSGSSDLIAEFVDGNNTNMDAHPYVDPATTDGDRELALKNMFVDITDINQPNLCPSHTGFKMDITHLSGELTLGINGSVLAPVSDIRDLNGIILDNVRVTLDGIPGLDQYDPFDIVFCPMTEGRPINSIKIGAHSIENSNEEGSLALDNLERVECVYNLIDIVFTPPDIIEPPDWNTPVWDFYITGNDWSWNLNGWWPPTSPNEALRPHYTNWNGLLLADDRYNFVIENISDQQLNWEIMGTAVDGTGSSGTLPPDVTGGGTITMGENAVCCVSESPFIPADCYEDMSKIVCEDIHGGTHYPQYATCEQAYADLDSNGAHVFDCPAGGCPGDKIDWEDLAEGDLPTDTNVYYASDHPDDSEDFLSGGVSVDVEPLPGFVPAEGIANYVFANDCQASVAGQEMLLSAVMLDLNFDIGDLPIDWLNFYASGSGPFKLHVNGWSSTATDLMVFDGQVLGGVNIEVISIASSELLYKLSLTGGAINQFEFGGAQVCLGDICYQGQDGSGEGHGGECAPADYEETVFESHPSFTEFTEHPSGSFVVETSPLMLPGGVSSSDALVIEHQSPEIAEDGIIDIHEVQLNNIAAKYTLEATISPGLAVDVAYLGGVFNIDLPNTTGTTPDLMIIGGDISGFEGLDGMTLNGVEITADLTSIDGGVSGTLSFCMPGATEDPSLSLEWLQIGGQELWIDNVRCIPCDAEILLGDINEDGNTDILDIILIVNSVLSGVYSAPADINEDGNNSILDIVQLVNLILSTPEDEDDDGGLI